MHTKMLMTGAIYVDIALMIPVYSSNRIKVTVKICLVKCLFGDRLNTPCFKLSLQNSGINLSSMAS
jgi:hypothetical protein